MIRIVAQHAPNLFAILGLFDESEAEATAIRIDDEAYYRAETHDHWVLFKRAITGQGIPHDEDPGLESTSHFEPLDAAYSFGLQLNPPERALVLAGPSIGKG